MSPCLNIDFKLRNVGLFNSATLRGQSTPQMLRITLRNVGLFSSVILRKKVGGDKRDRTVDPLLARQVLSQLSYTPTIERTFGPSKLISVNF